MKFLIDTTSLVATCDAEIQLKEIERRLNRKKLTLGYDPASGTTLRQALEKRIPNRLSLRYGEINDICMAVRVDSRYGMIQTKKVPRAATGPDFKKILIGSGQRYGRILEATLRVVPRPEERRTLSFTWRKRSDKQAFVKILFGSGIRPSRLTHLGQTVIQLHLEGMKGIVDAEVRSLKRLAKGAKGSRNFF